MNRKMVPPAQSRVQDDGGYTLSSQTYGQKPKSSSAENGKMQRTTNGSPNGKVVLEGYRNDLMNGFEGETPRFNPMNANRPQSSMLLNTSDPIQVHLLVETALHDSASYELLSEEEVDGLKAQIKTLEQRIEQTRQNLAVQSKYRDAAISMGKLYSPRDSRNSNGEKKRRSLLGLRNNNSDQVDAADHEREASERKCEELALELWGLEKRIMEPQRRLLQHTAGILQMTHKGPVKVNNANGGGQAGTGLMPGSPESMYTYNNARSSIGTSAESEDLFDERSLYRTFDRLDGLGFGRESWDGSKARSGGQSAHLDIISRTEQKLEDLNNRLREVIVKSSPEFGQPPAANETSGEPGKLIYSHLDYLEHGIKSIGTMSQTQGSSEEYETTLNGLWDLIQSGEEDIRQRALQDRLRRSDAGLPEDEDDDADDLDGSKQSFSLQAFSAKVQQLFAQATGLKEKKKVLQRQIKQQRELNSKDNSELSTRLEETENQARDLQSQLTTVMQQFEESRRDNEGNGAAKDLQQKIAQLEDELQEMKDDREIGNAETQSRLADAHTKVEALKTQLADAETKAGLVTQKEKEIEARNMQIAVLTTEVTIARAELDGAYGSRAQRAAEVAANPAIQKEIDSLTTQNKTLESELSELKAKMGDGEGGGDRVKQLQKELGETIEEYEVMTKASIEWEKEREGLEREIDKLRDDRESLEAKLSDEQVRWLGMKSPGLPGQAGGEGSGGAGATSTMVLKNEFKKMMRDTRAEGAKALRAEQAERRRLEDEIRILKKAQGPGKSSLSQSLGP